MMRDALNEMLSSKKFLAAAVSFVALVLVTLAGRMHIGLDEASANDLAKELVALAVAYVVGQGVADHGKVAAEIAAATSSTGSFAPPVSLESPAKAPAKDEAKTS
jgi:hypothetical protein